MSTKWSDEERAFLKQFYKRFDSKNLSQKFKDKFNTHRTPEAIRQMAQYLNIDKSLKEHMLSASDIAFIFECSRNRARNLIRWAGGQKISGKLYISSEKIKKIEEIVSLDEGDHKYLKRIREASEELGYYSDYIGDRYRKSNIKPLIYHGKIVIHKNEFNLLKELIGNSSTGFINWSEFKNKRKRLALYK